MSWTTNSDGSVSVDGATPTLSATDAASFAARVVKPWGALALKYAQQLGVPVSRVLAFIWAESRGNAKARSSKGALGLMQILHPHWRGGLTEAEIMEPENNVMLGCKALAELGRADSDLASVASRYNAGAEAKTGKPHAGPPPWGYRAAAGYIATIIAANNSALGLTPGAVATGASAGVVVALLALAAIAIMEAE